MKSTGIHKIGEEVKCIRTIHDNSFASDGNYKCPKNATHNYHGLSMCEHHYNHAVKKAENIKRHKEIFANNPKYQPK